MSVYSCFCAGSDLLRLQASGLFGIVQDPRLDAFQHVDDRLVVVQAVHAGQAVAVGAAGHLGLALASHLDQRQSKPYCSG